MKNKHYLQNNWMNIGGIMGFLALLFLLLFHRQLSTYQLIMWISLVTLFCHQLEEYRIVGTFPGMVNTVMFHSETPINFPLNANTALIINVGIGWSIYLLAAIAGEKCVWLGIASILVSVGNVIAHTFIFNIKGKTFYNAGLATCWLLFVPCSIWFFYLIHHEQLASVQDYLIGIPMGIVINYVGILKMIVWMSNKNSPYHFKKRQLLPHDRINL